MKGNRMQYRIGIQHPSETTNGCMKFHTNWPLLIEDRTFAIVRNLELSAEQNAAIGKKGLQLVAHLLNDRRIPRLEIGFKHLQIAPVFPLGLPAWTGQDDGLFSVIVRNLAENAGLIVAAFELGGTYFLVDPAHPDEWNWQQTAISYRYLFVNGLHTE